MEFLANENIVYTKDKDISYIQFKKLLEYPELIHAFTVDKRFNFKTVSNNEKDKNYDTAINNYKLLCRTLNLNFNNSIRADLGHTDKVRIADVVKEANFDITEDKYDGLVTNKSNINLITTSADCIIFLIYDPINKVIANVHSGWRGTLQRIVIKTIIKMHNKFDSNYEDIIICICPSIRKCHFEADYDVFEMFYKEFKYDNIYEKKGNKWYIDTILINKLMLLELGVKQENIIDSNICTVCSGKYINSYRKDKENFKLNTSIISLVERR